MADDTPRPTRNHFVEQQDDGTMKRRRDSSEPPELTKLTHGLTLDAGPYVEQCRALEQQPEVRSGFDYFDDLAAEMKPRNSLERMLIAQALWQHKRIGHLTTIAARTTRADHLRGLNAAIDSGMSGFRKHVLALQQLREPRPVQFISAQQANIAERQIVNPSSPAGPDSAPRQKVENEQGSPHAYPPLPPVTAWPDVIAGLRAPREAVGEIHRAKDPGG